MTIIAVSGQRGDHASARERLLDATSELLSERDTLDFSLAQVSKRAGLNHGLVGYYFGGKEGLLLALLERAATAALGALERLVATKLPPLRKIELHIHGVLSIYLKHPYINRLINMLQCGNDANAQALSDVFITPLRSYQRQMLDEAFLEGSIRKVDPSLFYYTLIGACDFLFQSRQTLPHVTGATTITETMKTDYADHLVDLLVLGLRPRPEAKA